MNEVDTFCKEHSITIEQFEGTELIKLTDGEYGNDQLCEFYA